MLLPTTKLSFPSLTPELFMCILVGVITAAMAKPRSELSAGPELLPERLRCQRKRRRRMYQLGGMGTWTEWDSLAQCLSPFAT